MADNSEDKIVDKLTSEGQLIRNTGANSIKSVNLRLDRFEDIFQTIQFNVVMQSAMLREMIDIDNNALKMQMEEARRAENARLLSLVAGNDDNKSVNKSVEKSRTDIQTVNRSGLLPTFDFAELLQGGRGLLSLGTLFKGGLAAFLAPIIGEFVGDFVEQSMLNANFSEELSKSLGDAADRGAMAATIGSIFGKRAAAVFGAAGFASSFSDEMMDFMGLDPNNMQNILGMEFSNQQITEGILGAAGLAAGTALTSESLWKSLLNPVYDTVSAISKNAKFLIMTKGLQLGAATAIMGLYLAYGDEAKLWLEENAGMPQGFADMAVDGLSFAATGASLGSMFGPKGALVGAGLGLAVGIGATVLGWLQKNYEETKQKYKEALDKTTDEEILDAFSSGDMAGLNLGIENTGSVNASDRERMIRERVSSMGSVALSSTLGTTQTGGSELASAETFNMIADKFYGSENLSQEELDLLYSNLLNMKANIDSLIELNPAQDTVERNILNNLQNTGVIDDLPVLMEDLKAKGAQAGMTPPKVSIEAPVYQDAILRRASNPLPNISPVISSQPTLNTISSGTAASSVVYAPVTNAPTTNIYQGGGSVSNNSTVVVGSTGMDLDRPGYAK
jgi:hypothetical protein